MAGVLASTTQVRCISLTYGLDQDKVYSVLQTFTPHNGRQVTEIKVPLPGYPDGKWYDAYRFEPVTQEPFKDLVKANLQKYLDNIAVNGENSQEFAILSSFARTLGFTVETTTTIKVTVS